MIQRVQSVYLLLVTVLMSFLLVRPYAEIKIADGNRLMFYSWSVQKQISEQDPETFKNTMPLFLLVIITGMLNFINIFFFNRRLLQIRLCIVSVIILVLMLILMFMYYSGARSLPDQTVHAFRLAMILPILAMIMNFMAYRGIHHDELLVNSYNRIR